MSRTAETWDSYEPVLLAVVFEFRPKRVLEWGSGKSTYTLSRYVSTIDTVEHDSGWVMRLSNVPDNVNLIYEPNLLLYPFVSGRYDKYDLIFVDGKEREKCLENALDIMTDNGIVIIHDAERPQYLRSISMYKFIHWKDGGHTAVMANNANVNKRLEKCLETLK